MGGEIKPVRGGISWIFHADDTYLLKEKLIVSTSVCEAIFSRSVDSSRSRVVMLSVLQASGRTGSCISRTPSASQHSWHQCTVQHVQVTATGGHFGISITGRERGNARQQ